MVTTPTGAPLVVTSTLTGPPLVVLWRSALTDDRLTFRARGFLAYFLALPPDRPINRAALAAQTPAGEDEVRQALAELHRHGYLEPIPETLPDEAGGQR